MEFFSGVFRTFGGSFSAVWTATIARVGAFCSVFQTVQDSPAKSEEFCKPSHQFSKFRQNFAKFSKFCKFSFNTAFFRCKFHRFFSEFHGMLGNCSKYLNFEDFSEISQNLGRKNVQRPEKPRKKFYLKQCSREIWEKLLKIFDNLFRKLTY